MSLSVEQLKDILVSCLDEERNVTDMAGALDVITKLQTVSINRETLESTRLGLLVNDIRRKNQDINPQLGKLCRGLIKDWQKLVTPATTQSNSGGKLGVSPAQERLTTPSGRTATPRQAATAKLIAESGLRCSPSPASTPKLQPTTPMVNGRSSTGVSPESSQLSQRPAATSSYAPSEQATTNGPAQSAVRIRIKYGSADQQASIVREIDPSSPRVNEHAQSANESANVSQGAEEVANRRKRKAPPDHPSRTSLGLVNGGSKSVSPCTSAVPSPAPSMVNTNSPASVPPAESSTVIAPVTKMTKKSKSTSPDTGPTPAASTNLLQRPKLKSTAELVAEMTSSYPETMSISLKNVVSTPASPPIAASMATGSLGTSVMASVLAAEADASDASEGEDDSKDEDYKEPGSKKNAKVMWTSTLMNDRNNSGFRPVNKTELLDRYLRDHSSEPRRQRRDKVQGKESGIESAVTTRRAPVVHPPIDWYSAVQLPPVDFSVLESLQEEEAGEECDASGSGREVCDKTKETVATDLETDVGKFLDAGVLGDEVDQSSTSAQDEHKLDGVQWRSRLLKTTRRGDRQVLAMPYVDIGLPDFLEYGYTNREQYLAHWSER